MKGGGVLLLVVGLALLYVMVTGRAEAVWGALKAPGKKKK
jgi:hypothetical protein